MHALKCFLECAQTERGRTPATIGEKEGRATAAISGAEKRTGGNPGKIHGKSEEANIYDHRTRKVHLQPKKALETSSYDHLAEI